MCGIAGLLLNKPNEKLCSKVLKISKSLQHRGPDASSSFQDQKNLLIHTRLSIIDIRGGNQPLSNKNIVLVANGEIYNDPEIRVRLEKYKFKTNSDSETITALYYEEGIEGLKKLRGMYAFALYDKKKNLTILSRDVFGIKPLYFSKIKEGIVFSSEIRPLISLNLIGKDISNSKLLEYLELQYCSGKGTIYKNIQRITPGELLVIEDGKISNSILQKFPKKKVLKKKINESFIEKKLKESVSAHLRSDVPYCLFFSGGIDSMLIMYLMSRLGLKKVTSYKINIEGKSLKNDLLKKISSEFSVEFNEINFDEKDFWNLIPFAAKNIDEPIADYAILPTFKLAKEASKDFKVAITGEGGDELFGGYGRYKTRILKNRTYFKPAFKRFKNFSKDHWKFENSIEIVENLDLTELQKNQYFDYINWLPNNLLVKLDRCLMSYGMEGRTPLIDKKLFESFFYIHDSSKINKGHGKFLIRSFLKNKIQCYNSFHKKEGFSVPINDWIPKKSKILEELLPRVDFLNYFFTKDEIIKLCRSVSYSKKNIRALWHLIFISAWYSVSFKNKKIDGDFFDLISN